MRKEEVLLANHSDYWKVEDISGDLIPKEWHPLLVWLCKYTFQFQGTNNNGNVTGTIIKAINSFAEKNVTLARCSNAEECELHRIALVNFLRELFANFC